ncbi:solute carrier family 52, riboflavin transporter, member 3-A-like isoform X2 [Uloborus diversus]|uniref:solute carrier family 52, riboflavin transporter, member 3-A-like isoform X2 n=1 Tax=Uloborus diversus TaxID=327109 RepID=UPI00240A4743|nr:solute carrier family 52, riboflavin transporter, member 3-A-like isoform X2 [Uloborus diversus]
MANRRPKLRVQLLSAAFGLGSWIAMTGLWVELPVLVQRLPEGWALPSQLALYLQVANIGPIAYGFCHHWWPKYVTEEAANHLQLAIGALSTLLVIFMWTWTASGISFAFFLLSFGLSLVDCTSSVTFLPYMANFRACYLTPYLVGEGLSGLLPSLVAMAQGIEDPTCVNETRITFSAETGQNVTFFEMIPHVNEPRFSPEWFFGFLLALVIVSWLAFIALDKMPLCQAERVPSTEGNNSHDQAHELESLNELQKNDVSFKNGDVIIRNAPHSHLLYYYLLFLQGWASVATFGIFPALQLSALRRRTFPPDCDLVRGCLSSSLSLRHVRGDEESVLDLVDITRRDPHLAVRPGDCCSVSSSTSSSHLNWRHPHRGVLGYFHVYFFLHQDNGNHLT